MATGLEGAKAGMGFRAVVKPTFSLDKFRAEVMEETGLRVHVLARFGPATLKENGAVVCPIEAVDDPYLDGTFAIEFIPFGCSVYFFRLDEPKVTMV